MNYETLVDKLSKRSGIHKELFNLDDFDTKRNTEKKGKILLQVNNDREHYFSGREYWENTDERWRSVVLFVPVEIVGQFVEIINSILSEDEKEIINLEANPNEFKYLSDDEGLYVMLGQKKDDFYRIEFARKKNKKEVVKTGVERNC